MESIIVSQVNIEITRINSRPITTPLMLLKGEEQPLKAGDFALVNPDEKHQYWNKGNVPFKMICGVPKEFE